LDQIRYKNPVFDQHLGCNEAANPKPKVLDGIWSYSIVSAFWLSILIKTGVDVSETGLAASILDATAKLFPPDLAWVAPVIGILLTGIDVLYMIKQVLHIAMNGINGLVASSTGFFGTLMLLLGSMYSVDGLPLIGFLVIAAGVVYLRFTE
jgi:hypothetical protein